MQSAKDEEVAEEVVEDDDEEEEVAVEDERGGGGGGELPEAVQESVLAVLTGGGLPLTDLGVDGGVFVNC